MRPVFAAVTTVALMFTAAAGAAAAEETAPKAAVVTDNAAAAKPPKDTGAVVDISAAAVYTGGQVGSGATLGTLQTVFGVRGGYYFTRHVGFVAGLELGFGQMMTGCVDDRGKDSEKCGAFSAKVPLLVQYAVESRTKGVYFEGGVSAAHVHGLTGTDQLAVFFSPADLAIGIGLRVPSTLDPKTKTKASGAIDFRFRGEAGTFTMGSYRDGNTAVSGDVTNKAIHYGLTLAVARQF